MIEGNVDETSSRWRAAASPGGLIGVLLAILSLLLAGGAIWVLTGQASIPLPTPVVWLGLVVGVALTAGFAYLVWAYLSIDYEIGERTLTLRWGLQRHVIDLESIRHIGPAIDQIEERPGGWQRFWPGYYVGTRRAKVGNVRVIATLPLRRQLLISTADRDFAISPERPVLFVEEYGRLRRALDLQRTGGFPTVEPGQGAKRLADAGWTMQYPVITTTRPAPAPTPSPPRAGDAAPAPAPAPRPARATHAPRESALSGPLLLDDRLSLGFLGGAVLLNILMVVYILIQYDTIPQSIPLHWNVNGLPDRIGSPREIWTLPLITGLVTVANFGLAWSIVTFDRFAARALLGATCLVQIVAWVALITLIH